TPKRGPHARLFRLGCGDLLERGGRGSRNQEMHLLPRYAQAAKPRGSVCRSLLGGENGHNSLHGVSFVVSLLRDLARSTALRWLRGLPPAARARRRLGRVPENRATSMPSDAPWYRTRPSPAP